MKEEEGIRVELPDKRRIRKHLYYYNLGQYRNWHWAISNDLKKNFAPMNIEDIPVFITPIKIEYYFKMRKNADIDNKIIIVKFFQDWLVKTGRLDDDNKCSIIEVIMRPAPEKVANSYCIITPMVLEETKKEERNDN